jgi:hypothetical protein
MNRREFRWRHETVRSHLPLQEAEEAQEVEEARMVF